MKARFSGWRAALARREGVIGINRRNVELVYAHNPRAHYPLADDKLLTKQHLAAAGVSAPETLGTCDELGALPAFLETLTRHDSFVLKPARSSGGKGLLVVQERLGAERWRRAGGAEVTLDELRRHAANIIFGTFSKDRPDVAFAEERIVPHPFFALLWGDGLCDVRVITLTGTPIMAMIRLPTRRAGGRANLHQGGIGLAVDLASGRTQRAWYRRGTVEHHPETGVALLGLEVPSWPAIVATARATAAEVPLGYLGVDLVVDQEGRALVLEINARPGLEIQNVTGHGLAALVDAQLARSTAP